MKHIRYHFGSRPTSKVAGRLAGWLPGCASRCFPPLHASLLGT